MSTYPEIIPPKGADVEEVRRWREDVSDRLSYQEADIDNAAQPPLPTDDPTIVDPTIPVPTGASAVGGFGGVHITWTKSLYTGYWSTDIFWSLTNDYLTSVKVGDSTQESFFHSYADPDPSVLNYYWVRFVNTSVTPGPFNSSFSSSVGESPDYILDITKEQIGFDQMLPGEWPVRTENPLPLLPDATYPIGCVVLLLSDGKLYRNLANVWSAEVAFDDVSNVAITANQLTTDCVVAGKIAAGAIVVNDGVISNAAIRSAQIGSVNASTINTGTLNASVVDVVNLDADNIITGTIDATTINVTNLNATELTSGIFTGLKFRTAASNERIEITDPASSTPHRIVGYNAGGFEEFYLSASGTLLMSNGGRISVTNSASTAIEAGGTRGIVAVGTTSFGGQFSSSSSYGVHTDSAYVAGNLVVTGTVTGSFPPSSHSSHPSISTAGSVACGSLRIAQTPSVGTGTATVNTTNKPGVSSTNKWLSINCNGTTYYLPAWT